jgi:hypothetical protein
MVTFCYIQQKLVHVRRTQVQRRSSDRVPAAADSPWSRFMGVHDLSVTSTPAPAFFASTSYADLSI